MSCDWICKLCKGIMEKIDDDGKVVYCKKCNHYEALFFDYDLK
jgi:hypothetical protein